MSAFSGDHTATDVGTGEGAAGRHIGDSPGAEVFATILAGKDGLSTVRSQAKEDPLAVLKTAVLKIVTDTHVVGTVTAGGHIGKGHILDELHGNSAPRVGGTQEL